MAGASAAFLIMGTLAASAGTLESFFGNTVTATLGDQSTVLLYNEDGTFADGAGATGKWAIEDGNICHVADADSAKSCSPLPEGKAVGDTWETTDEENNVWTISVSQGR
jgi:hypothetical protein